MADLGSNEDDHEDGDKDDDGDDHDEEANIDEFLNAPFPSPALIHKKLIHFPEACVMLTSDWNGSSPLDFSVRADCSILCFLSRFSQSQPGILKF